MLILGLKNLGATEIFTLSPSVSEEIYQLLDIEEKLVINQLGERSLVKTGTRYQCRLDHHFEYFCHITLEKMDFPHQGDRLLLFSGEIAEDLYHHLLLKEYLYQGFTIGAQPQYVKASDSIECNEQTGPLPFFTCVIKIK